MRSKPRVGPALPAEQWVEVQPALPRGLPRSLLSGAPPCRCLLLSLLLLHSFLSLLSLTKERGSSWAVSPGPHCPRGQGEWTYRAGGSHSAAWAPRAPSHPRGPPAAGLKPTISTPRSPRAGDWEEPAWGGVGCSEKEGPTPLVSAASI